MKPDERLLLQKLKDRGDTTQIPIDLPYPSAWDIAKSIGMHHKRARYILRDKWGDKEWYEYGTSWRSGWLQWENVPNE